MKSIKLFLLLMLGANCAGAAAPTNAPAKTAPERELLITSGSFYYDGITNQIVYIGHVFVTDHVQACLQCERLTVFLPPNGGQPTNILAETNVVVDLKDSSGQTNHITAQRAVYAYSVGSESGHAITNETVTFSAGDPKVEHSKGTIWGDPLIYYVREKRFEASGPTKMIFHQSVGGTNASPFDFSK